MTGQKVLGSIINLPKNTLHAVFRGTADFAQDNLSSEWPKYDESKFHYADNRSWICTVDLHRIEMRLLLTVDVDDTSTVTNQPVGCLEYIINTNAQANFLDDLSRC